VQTANRAQKSGQIRQTKVGAQVSIGLFRRRSDLSITAPGMPTEQANAALMGFVADLVDHLAPDWFCLTPGNPGAFDPGFRFGVVSRAEFLAVIEQQLSSPSPAESLRLGRQAWAAPDTEFSAFDLTGTWDQVAGAAERCLAVRSTSRLAVLRRLAQARGVRLEVDDVAFSWRSSTSVERWRLAHDILSEAPWGGWSRGVFDVSDREDFGSSLNRLLWIADLLTTVRAHIAVSSGGWRGDGYWTRPIDDYGQGKARWSPVLWVVESEFPDLAELVTGGGLESWWHHVETFGSLFESFTSASISPEEVAAPTIREDYEVQNLELLGSRHYGVHRIDVLRRNVEFLNPDDPDSPDFARPPYSSIVMRIVGETSWSRGTKTPRQEQRASGR
jgi:hypothetical protein